MAKFVPGKTDLPRGVDFARNFVARVSQPEFAIDYVTRLADRWHAIDKVADKTERDYGTMSGLVHALAEYTDLPYRDVHASLAAGRLGRSQASDR